VDHDGLIDERPMPQLNADQRPEDGAMMRLAGFMLIQQSPDRFRREETTAANGVCGKKVAAELAGLSAQPRPIGIGSPSWGGSGSARATGLWRPASEDTSG
jgi:hypothetical protein